DRAENWEDFLAAMRRWKLPPENFVYADVQGNIGEQSAGLAPRRRWTGLVPMPGDRKYEWQGFRTLEELPRSFNPASGFEATANHKMVAANDPHPVGFEWAPPYRFERIRDVLANAHHSGRKLQLADMQALQNDVRSLPAQRLLRLLVQTPAKDDPAGELLLAWDGTVTANSPAAALYEVWLQKLRRGLAERAVSGNLVDVLENQLWPPVMLRWLENPPRSPLAYDRAGPIGARDKLLSATLQ